MVGAIIGTSKVDIRGLKPTPRYGGSLKSNVSDYLEMAHYIYKDACAKCIADVSDPRDLETIRSRVKQEGLSFLTISLPKFCNDFERSLANGYIDSKYFQGFRKYRSIPSFLRGMISQLFDHETGRIYDETTIAANDFPTIIESVRQICLSFKKIEVDCAPHRVTAAFANFVAIEHEFSTFSLCEELHSKFSSVSSVLWDNMLHGLRVSELVPRHGPGATAEHISGNGKYAWLKWHDRLEPYFPLIGTAYPMGISDHLEELEKLTIVPETDELPVRVISVPKTLKSPRIIAIEPSCMQYTQQGIRSLLYETIESHWMTAGHVNFRDQSVNQSLAISSSNTGRLATIDLSDASDRVPHDLAMEMFRSNPDLQGAIDACRSTRAKLPDGTVIGPLRKFASMGSALCFPIEAMYFYTICVVALLESNCLPVTSENVFNVSRDVYVYGDDILVPTTNAVTVLDYLQKYNCKVNVNKTFCSGNFRESCGIDAYRGYEVTPTYLRHLRPKNRQQATNLSSWVATANLFYKKGYWSTSSFMFKCIEAILGPLPYVSDKSGSLGRNSFLGYRSATRWNDKLQRLEVKAWTPRPIYRKDELEGYGALTKSFLNLEALKNLPVSRDALHLEHSAVYGALALILRWVPSLL